MALTLRRYPEIIRHDSRYAMRYAGLELSRLRFELRLPETNEVLSITLIDFTCRGFGIHLGPENQDREGLQAGDKVHVIGYNAKQRKMEYPCIIAHRGKAHAGGVKLGLRRIFKRGAHQGLLEMRRFPRLPLPATLGLVMTTPHPILFGHISRLHLVDIHFGMGLCLETEDPLFLGLEGQELTLFLPLPNCSDPRLSARIAWVQPVDKRRLRLGVQTVDMPFDLYDKICLYLLHTQVFTPGLLREAGLSLRHIRQDLRFRQVHTLQDYAAILQLRRQALYPADLDSIAPEAMAKVTDGQSRILSAWRGDTLIGVMTLHFPLAALESAGGIEIVDMAILPDHLGADIRQGFITQAAKALLLSERSFLRLDVAADECACFAAFGFRVPPPAAPGISPPNTHAMILHREALLGGQGIPGKVWNRLYGPVCEDLMRKSIIEPKPWIRLRLAFRRAMRPFCRANFNLCAIP